MLNRTLSWFLTVLPPAVFVLAVFIQGIKPKEIFISPGWLVFNVVIGVICFAGTITSFILYVFPNKKGD